MKKIIAIIMVIISVITLGYYMISMFSANKVDMNFKDVSGDRNVLKDHKIKLSDIKGYTAYEQTIGKQGSSVEKSYIEATQLSITKEEFQKNKSFYRGFSWLETPMYEDEQYKILINSTTKYENSTSSVSNELNISYEDKSVGKVNRLKLIAPVKVNGLNPMAIRNVNGKISYIYYGSSVSDEYKTKIVVASIDLKAGTIKKEKVIDAEKIFGTSNFNINITFSTDKNIYISCNNFDKEGAPSVNIYAMDLKNYNLRKINMDTEKVEVDSVEKINGDILFHNIKNGKLIINKFNDDTETVTAYKEINLPKEYSQNRESDKVKGGVYVRFINIIDNKLYLVCTNEKDSQRFIEVLDANNGNSLYKCAVAQNAGNIIVE